MYISAIDTVHSLCFVVLAVKPVDPLVIILGVLLGVCIIVITAQAVLSHKKERYYNNKGEHFDLICLLQNMGLL